LSNLLVALSAWFAGLFGLPLLYAARNNKARDAEGFTASGDDLATPTGFAV
jgi:uncharacterized membrane protein